MKTVKPIVIDENFDKKNIGEMVEVGKPLYKKIELYFETKNFEFVAKKMTGSNPEYRAIYHQDPKTNKFFKTLECEFVGQCGQGAWHTVSKSCLLLDM